ncbi:MAG TPA: energy transducer TonB [Gammaproteobacteria bacterium]|nr:energy transducer TonB [Gammaproteobacteria bacterium]
MNRVYLLGLAVCFMAGGAAWAADDPEYTAPTVGVMQVTPKQKREKKKPLNIKIDAPKLNLGVNTGVSGLTSFATQPTHNASTEQETSGRGPVVKPLRPIRMQAPQYPAAALGDRASATVKVMFTVREDGSTDNIRILTQNAPEAFQNATRDAVRSWRFHPTTVDGDPRAQRVTQTIHFTPPPRAPAPKSAPQSSGRGPSLSGPAPVPVHIVPPQYPRAAARRHAHGYVVVAFTVNSNGSTSDIEVVSSEPRQLFDKAARDAVQQWLFKPYRIDGKPASIRVKQRIQFSQ